MSRRVISTFLACLLLGTAGIAAAGCAKNDKPEADRYAVTAVSAGDGYAVQIKKGDAAWDNAASGVFGVKLSYDDVRKVSQTEFAYYDALSAIENGLLGTATLQTEDGSRFEATDTYTVFSGGVEMARSFRVLSVGAGAQGFMTYFPLHDTADLAAAEARKWFAPGAFYGNAEATFWGTGVKIGFGGEESVANVDNLSAPVVMNHHNGNSFSITDLTEGHRETISADAYAAVNRIFVDETFNIPGIGLKNLGIDGEGGVEMYHCYPSNTYNYINCFPFTNIYRMLPIEAGLTREVALRIGMDRDADFDTAVERQWRDVYTQYAVTDSRYAPLDVYKALAENIHKSYGILRDVPQYMVNTDHPYTESGFLYRNADLAYLMIAAGYKLDKPEYIDTAIGLIDFHIKKDLIVDNILVHFERSETEGVIAVLDAYKELKAHGVEKNDWLAYVLKKAEQKKDVTDPMVLPLFLQVAAYTKDNRFIERAKRILEEARADNKSFYYHGAIVNFAGDAIAQREAGMVYMNIYLDMYDLTGDTQYLAQARHAEVYVESNMVVQNIAMETEGSTGYEYLSDGRFREIGTVGNAQIKPYGLSWVSGQTASADNASAYSVPDILRLYERTKEKKYLDFAKYLMFNSLLYVNMGDKTWLMDDIRHSAGIGFQNEYFGISASSDPVSAGRGTMHMSNLGWNMYFLLNSLNRWAAYDGAFLSEEATAFDNAAMKYTRATSADGMRYRSYNAVDNDAATAWRPAAGDTERALTADLEEFVSLTSVNVTVAGVTAAEVFTSTDGAAWTKVPVPFGAVMQLPAATVARYVKLVLTDAGATAAVYDLKAVGTPVVGKNYALGREATLNGVATAAMTDWNYATSRTAPSSTGTVVLDLGAARDITEVSIFFKNAANFRNQDYIGIPVASIGYSYKIEYAIVSDIWSTFADRTAESVIKAVYKEQRAVRARYIRITAAATQGNVTFTEIKVLGL